MPWFLIAPSYLDTFPVSKIGDRPGILTIESCLLGLKSMPIHEASKQYFSQGIHHKGSTKISYQYDQTFPRDQTSKLSKIQFLTQKTYFKILNVILKYVWKKIVVTGWWYYNYCLTIRKSWAEKACMLDKELPLANQCSVAQNLHHRAMLCIHKLCFAESIAVSCVYSIKVSFSSPHGLENSNKYKRVSHQVQLPEMPLPGYFLNVDSIPVSRSFCYLL